MRKPILVLALAGALAACSDDSGPSGPPLPACDRTTQLGGTCWVNSTLDPLTAQNQCTSELGTWSAGGCPGGEIVGVCSQTTGRVTYYYTVDYGMYASHDAALACGMVGGTFVAMGPIVTASCDLRANPMFGFCIEGTGTISDVDPASLNEGCPLLGGTSDPTGPCPTAGRTGTCSYESGGVDVNARYYNGETALDVSCTGPGETWTPG